MSKFTKHLGKPIKKIIDGEEFEFKPLNIDSLQDFLLVMGSFGKYTEKELQDNPTKAVESLDEKTSDKLKRLITETLKVSYPEENEEDRKAFALKHFMVLMEALFEVNDFGGSSNIEMKKKIEEIKRIRNEQTTSD
jgi:hypothetical protein|tara:strand:+ start:22358 stop:22765 length:408 start_codon:yes stop_codon:yes gene_type:complete